MVIEIQPLHYGHSDGHTDICYSEDGDKIISCGGDGDVRIWNGFDDDDPLQTCLGEFVLCIKHKKDHILVSTDNNNVQLLSYSSSERDGILTRFTAHVNHMAVSKSHNWVALASEDMTIKVIDIISKETKTISGLNGPPLSVSICPNSKHLAASCGDGRLIIYNIADQSIIKEIHVVPKANSILTAKLLCRIDFDQKQDKYFAYPDKNVVYILNTSDWSQACSLSTECVDSAYSIVSFSPCSNYICAVSLEGDIVVWGLRSQMLVGYKKHPKSIAITSISWNPKENGDLAFADAQGFVGLAVNCTNCERSKPEPVIEANIENNSNSTKEGMYDDDVDFGDVLIADDDDDDNENAISLEKLKKDIMGPSDPDNDDKASSRSASPLPRSRTPEIPLQPPFMPTSTPEHLDPRYMCWNEVGIVRSYGANLDENDEGNRSIEVEFHDYSIHSSIMMKNFQGFSMGSISTAALAVANSSMINVLPLGSSSKEWHLTLLEDEEIVCIATSHNLICFATANFLVYVCSIFGNQKAVLSIPGPIITITAFGHVLMIAYHATGSRKGDQCIEIMLVKLEGTSIENRNIKSALAPGATLQWIGFSDVGTPALADSTGMVYLYPLQSNLWLPFCDTNKTRKSPLDGFFVTAIYESFGTVRGIRCKGSMYPGFTPRPTAIELELQQPFAELTTEKSQLEANLLTWSILQVDNTDKKFKETALKTFALAAKNNLEQRALELVEMLGNPQVLTLALKYATKLDKRRLAEKLMELTQKMESGEDEIDNSTPAPTATSVIKPSRQLLVKCMNKIKERKKQTATPSELSVLNSPRILDESQDIYSSSKPSTSFDTQDLSLLEDEPKMPFLKSSKNANSSAYNPLSLTDKYAGFDDKNEKKEKENKNSNEGAVKRKNPETSSAEKNKEKQRKLDRFMFTKRT